MGLTGIVLTPGSFNLTSHSCGHGFPLGTIILQSSFLILPLSPVQRQSSSSFLIKSHSAVFSTQHDISQVLDKSSPLPWLSCEVSQGFSRRNMRTITAWLRTSAPVQRLMDRTCDHHPPPRDPASPLGSQVPPGKSIHWGTPSTQEEIPGELFRNWIKEKENEMAEMSYLITSTRHKQIFKYTSNFFFKTFISFHKEPLHREDPTWKRVQ